MAYRKLQIFVLWINLALQEVSFPIVQFGGSTLTICLLYAVIVFLEQLPGSVLVLLVTFLLLIFIACAFILDYGSKPIVKSDQLLETIVGWEKPSPMWQVCLRSCQPVALKMGPFHKIDKGRVPAMVRFCLQRTFFFVVNTNGKRD